MKAFSVLFMAAISFSSMAQETDFLGAVYKSRANEKLYSRCLERTPEQECKIVGIYSLDFKSQETLLKKYTVALMDEVEQRMSYNQLAKFPVFSLGNVALGTIYNIKHQRPTGMTPENEAMADEVIYSMHEAPMIVGGIMVFGGTVGILATGAVATTVPLIAAGAGLFLLPWTVDIATLPIRGIARVIRQTHRTRIEGISAIAMKKMIGIDAEAGSEVEVSNRKLRKMKLAILSIAE